MSWLSQRLHYLRQASEHSTQNKAVTVIAGIVVLYEIITQIAPFLAFSPFEGLVVLPKLSLEWAAVIVLLWSVFLLAEGGYRLFQQRVSENERLAEQTDSLKNENRELVNKVGVSYSIIENARQDNERLLGELEKLNVASRWEKLAADFERITPTVRATLQHGGLGWNGEEIIDRWDINGEGYKDCIPLCKKAGAILLDSPRVAAKLSSKVKSEADPVNRWLHYLQENHGAVRFDTHGVTMVAGKRQAVVMGDINELGRESARACRHCSAEEL